MKIFTVLYCLYLHVVVEIAEINSTFCPGQMVVFTCSSDDGTIGWRIKYIYEHFDKEDNVNDIKMVLDFVAKLTARNGSSCTSTLTHPMISSAHDGLVIWCIRETFASITIDVAGRYKI